MKHADCMFIIYTYLKKSLYGMIDKVLVALFELLMHHVERQNIYNILNIIYLCLYM